VFFVSFVVEKVVNEMIFKEYQKRTVESVREFLEELAALRAKEAKARELDPDLSFDWVRKAWEKCVPSRAYQARKNGLGEPLPSFCLKIPTGGGKTLLATRVVDLVNTQYRKKQNGLVLWIVPSTQIYNQTLRALKDRDHPYRQMLDMASAGRTLIFKKTSGFSPLDVTESLCVLLLMLPSANRETKEQLRMFRDSGGFDRFFPADDDLEAHKALLAKVPNLDTFEQQDGFWGRQIKTSLGNTLRLLQPLIIMDEGHKSYSVNAMATLEGFNPCMIVELSATPTAGANVLVEIFGKELNAEEMIKLDLHIQNRASTNWKDTLLAAIEHRRKLEDEARKHEAQTGTYIRPICLIQVERTGKDQRKAGVIHADDVKEYLVSHPDIREEEIAIKTSQTDELKEVDEVGGLLARDCPIRFIITKQALQEGWDCSFAYVLVILTNPGSKSALTQLVGRILRQPYAKKTPNLWLNESYVFCFQRKGADLLNEVRKGFGVEGLGDLQGRIVEDIPGKMAGGTEVIFEQRKAFRKAARNLVLPAFMIREGKEWRLVHYEADILSRVPWGEVDVSPLLDLPLGTEDRKDIELRAGLDEGILENSPDVKARTLDTAPGAELDYAFAASHLLDVIPNPWRGTELARQVFDSLLQKHQRKRVTDNFVFVLEEIRKQLERERDRLAQAVFAELLEAGTMRFMVVTDELGFNRLPRKAAVQAGQKKANREDGNQFILSLFEFVPEDDLNGLENKVATYLDKQEQLFFWYRNRQRRDYFVQGWKRHRIFADFVFTLRPDEPDADDDFHKVFVTETKGMHLKKTPDTDYKRSVFDICNEHAQRKKWNEFVPAMRGKVMRFEVVDEEEWEKRLTELLARDDAPN
jgi:type III restriction enzyme